ncbi:secretin N-terminal domain-containing protein [Candidatus Halobeggiatoa sp. HSG11]|nr:secretin N-terminal domain-containing protein [Candidatus Halobeggiatoa sp. HSG11]
MKKLYILIVFTLISCSAPKSKTTLPELLREPITEASSNLKNTPATSATNLINNTRFQSLPSPPSRKTTSATISDIEIPHFKTNKPVVVNIESLPLPAFINEVFGNLLDLSFEMNKDVSRKKDLVTLRINEPQTPTELYNLTIQVLANYQVGAELKGNFIQFLRQKKQQADTPSLLVEGLALPDVPPSHRPIIHFVILKVVAATQVKIWLEEAFKGHELNTRLDLQRNAIILVGRPQVIKQAIRAIEVLDQPLMRSQYSLRIEPAVLSATVLSKHLITVLKSQGYAASGNANNGSIIVLPFEETDAIIVFAGDAKVLAFVQKWAEKLDHINTELTESEDEKPKLFSYKVKHIAADLLVETLNQLLKPTVGKTQNNKRNKPNSKNNLQNNAVSQQSKIVVDENRNALIFIGFSEEWKDLLPVIKDMDVAPKQVLIEATIANVVLSKDSQNGIEWVLNSAGVNGLDGSISSMTSQVGSSGLLYSLSSAGKVRAKLNAFVSNGRATILSTPRLMVRSGSEATIDVGDEIPTLTSQATSSDLQMNGNSAILQQVQYRKTGTSLSIKPTVYAGRRVDLQISQEVSSAQPNSTSAISSPTISSRSINTELSLQDGHSVLLGGLISTTSSEDESGIPFLKDLPIIGQLFRVNGTSTTRTELIIMIVPYVIDNDEEAVAIADTLQSRLKLLPNLSKSKKLPVVSP